MLLSFCFSDWLTSIDLVQVHWLFFACSNSRVNLSSEILISVIILFSSRICISFFLIIYIYWYSLFADTEFTWFSLVICTRSLLTLWVHLKYFILSLCLLSPISGIPQGHFLFIFSCVRAICLYALYFANIKHFEYYNVVNLEIKFLLLPRSFMLVVVGVVAVYLFSSFYELVF